jgi:hypothetical protein
VHEAVVGIVAHVKIRQKQHFVSERKQGVVHAETSARILVFFDDSGGYQWVVLGAQDLSLHD